MSDRVSAEARSQNFGQSEGEGIIRCDACPVLCRIRPGRAGACSRYANEGGRLVRTDPALALAQAVEAGGPVVMPPSRQGFGSRLIRQVLASDLGAELSMSFQPTGLICTIAAPIPCQENAA